MPLEDRLRLRHPLLPPMGRPNRRVFCRRPHYHGRLPGGPGRDLVHRLPGRPPPPPPTAPRKIRIPPLFGKDLSICAAETSRRKPQTKTVNRLPEKWEKSGISPGNECYIMDKEEQYRLVELENFQLDLQALTRGLSKAAAVAERESHLRGVVELYPIREIDPLGIPARTIC